MRSAGFLATVRQRERDPRTQDGVRSRPLGHGQVIDSRRGKIRMMDGHASDTVAYRQRRQFNLASVVAERNSNTETLHHDGIEKELFVFPSEVKTAHPRARRACQPGLRHELLGKQPN